MARKEGVLKPLLTKTQSRQNLARRMCASLGYLECLSYSFIDKESANRFRVSSSDNITLINPISSDMSHMRQSLIPGLVKIIEKILEEPTNLLLNLCSGESTSFRKIAQKISYYLKAIEIKNRPKLVFKNDIDWIYCSKFGEFISPLKKPKHYSYLKNLKTIDSNNFYNLKT